MKNTIRFISLIALVLGINYSCSKDFLDKPPLGQMVATNFLVTDSNAFYGVIAIYNVIRAEETYAESEWVFGDVASDDAEAGGQKGNSDATTSPLYLDELLMQPSNERLSTYWIGMYVGVYRASVVINYLDTNKVSKSIARSCLGEALFLRSMIYFDLVKVFGGVPLPPKTGFITGKEARSTIKQDFTFIEADLKKAIDLLPPYRPVDEEGRATSASAKALLAKLYVFESSYAELSDPYSIYTGCTNRWAEAQATAEDLINNKNSYQIDLDANYNNIFHFHNVGANYVKTSPEYIFKVNSLRKAGYGYPNINYNPDGKHGSEWSIAGGGVGSAITTWQACRGYYDAKGKIVDNFNIGYGFNCPTPELVNSFDPADPRLKFTVVFDKDSFQYTNKQMLRLSTDASPTGYNNKKYTPLTSAERGDAALDNNDAHVGNLDIKLIRFADVILWAAEACFKNGDVAKATTYVNMIRARARNSVSPASAQPADLASVTLDDIYKERRLELAMEGHRYFDLVRTGKAYSSLNNQTIRSTGQQLEYIQNTYDHFPIPVTEITLTNNLLTQNPGY